MFAYWHELVISTQKYIFNCKYLINRYLFQVQSHSAHSPAFRRKSYTPEKALHYKSLGHNSKTSDFHSA
nr:hypothetical protein [uncultured bacterium]